jgi:hypothetical protein
MNAATDRRARLRLDSDSRRLPFRGLVGWRRRVGRRPCHGRHRAPPAALRCLHHRLEPDARAGPPRSATSVAGARAVIEPGRVGTRGPSGDCDYLPTLLRSPLLVGARQEV